MLTPIDPRPRIDPRTGRRRFQILPDDLGEVTAHGMRESDYHQSRMPHPPTGLSDPFGPPQPMPHRQRAKFPGGVVGILLNEEPEDEEIGSPETDPVIADAPSALERDETAAFPLPGLERPQLDGERVGRARRTAGLAGLAGLLDVALNGGDSELAAVAGGVMRGANTIEAREQSRYADEMATYSELAGEHAERQHQMALQKELRRMQEEGRKATEEIRQDRLDAREKARYQYLGEQKKSEEEAELLDERVEIAVASNDPQAIVSALLDRDPSLGEDVAARFAAERLVNRAYELRGLAADAAKKEADVQRVQAQIAADRARARAQGALADKYGAEADLKRRTDPNARRGSTSRAAPTSTEDDEITPDDISELEGFVRSGAMSQEEADAILRGDQ